jgi:hypothetical protein
MRIFYCKVCDNFYFYNEIIEKFYNLYLCPKCDNVVYETSDYPDKLP